MTKEEQRIQNLKIRQLELIELLDYLKVICSGYDLRVGQLITLVFGTQDIFSMENGTVKKRIQRWIENSIQV